MYGQEERRRKAEEDRKHQIALRKAAEAERQKKIEADKEKIVRCMVAGLKLRPAINSGGLHTGEAKARGG